MEKSPKKDPRGRKTASDEPADSVIVLRLPRAKKASYVRASRPGTLTAWCLAKLDEAAQ